MAILKPSTSVCLQKHGWYPHNEPDKIESLKDCFKYLEKCILKIIEWMNKSKLTINSDKTEFIIFELTRQKANLEINKLGDTVVKSSDSLRNLGEYLDSDLSMKTHVNHICNI